MFGCKITAPIYPMTFICLHSPTWTSGSLARPELCPALIRIAPRIVVDGSRSLIWADGRGLDAEQLSVFLSEALAGMGLTGPQIGIAQTAIAAEVASRTAQEVTDAAKQPATTTIVVPPGGDSAFLESRLITVLDPSPPLLALLEGTGIDCCGQLAHLDQESVEIRFGIEGLHVWRLARADDRRRIFAPMQRSLPEASYEWVEYTLTDPERLVFVINALVGKVCEALLVNGLCAWELTLLFSLVNRTTYEHLVRPARSTASPAAWMRLIRTHLERIQLPDGVTGMRIRVDSVTPESERQGDIFDRGFATARVTEETIAQLLDDQGAVVVVPENSRHPLVERRTRWMKQDPARAHGRYQHRGHASTTPSLTLQLLAQPRRVSVRVSQRRDHLAPVSYVDEGGGGDGDGWMTIESAAGPDRVSGAPWENIFAREYFRCLIYDGRLVWLYHDALDGEWYMHGWWD